MMAPHLLQVGLQAIVVSSNDPFRLHPYSATWGRGVGKVLGRSKECCWVASSRFEVKPPNIPKHSENKKSSI